MTTRDRPFTSTIDNRHAQFPRRTLSSAVEDFIAVLPIPSGGVAGDEVVYAA
jgi:hypothetical protein